MVTKKRGTACTRHVKQFQICANACHSNEQKNILVAHLTQAFQEIVSLDAKRKDPPETAEKGDNQEENKRPKAVARLASMALA